jgi:putative ABC transport system permease protein
MVSIAIKRLWHRPLLTLLSMAGVVLAVGLVTSIPILAQALSFVILNEEMSAISARTHRPLFSMRVYVLPSARYPLSLARTRELAKRIKETLTTEIGLPVLRLDRQAQTAGVLLRTGQGSPYSGSEILLSDTALAVLSGVGAHMTILEGESMADAPPGGGALNVWIHQMVADEMGLQAGEAYEVYDLRRRLSIPVRIAGIWRSTDPGDGYWFQDPELSLHGLLLVREEDYEAIAEPLYDAQLGFASWYLVMDDRLLAPDKMQETVDGLEAGVKIIAKFLPDARADSSPLAALGASIHREADLTALLFVFSVPLVGFLLYFLVLISTITVRWQQRETAMLVSRGMQTRQLLIVGAIESLIVIGVGCPLGILLGSQLARAMGYTQSFLSFTWREPLPISPTSFSVPMVVATVSATLLARLIPALRAARTSVVAHERARARAIRRPFWQRAYLDVALLIVVLYARDQLAKSGTLVPEAMAEGAEPAAGMSTGGLLARLYPGAFREQDPLRFLVPALCTVALSLLLVRLFPLLMRIGDWLSSYGRRVTPYLAFRQLARQSQHYTSALLLVITSLSLGAFMASMAKSLDQWAIDQVYYGIGADVLLKQMPKPSDDPFEPPPPPTDGAWTLPVSMYEAIPGVTHATRVGMYPVALEDEGGRIQPGAFIGIDRLDLPDVLFFRADFGAESLGEIMNRLAQHENGVIVSDKVLAQGQYEIGDPIRLRINVADVMLYEADFTIAGTYAYFPTVYEAQSAAALPFGTVPARCRSPDCVQENAGETAVIGNLPFLYDAIGATLLHYVWLDVDPSADRAAMIADIENMKVYINFWVDARDGIAREMAKSERVGIFGTLTAGFLGAAALSGIGLLVYNYASLQERLFRFTVLRAVGVSLQQVVSQVGIEYLVLMVYSIAGGAGIGALASRWFIPFFQAADAQVLQPPVLLPLIAWGNIARISAAFAIVLVVAQGVVISAALRGGVFQALRMGDQE